MWWNIDLQNSNHKMAIFEERFSLCFSAFPIYKYIKYILEYHGGAKNLYYNAHCFYSSKWFRIEITFFRKQSNTNTHVHLKVIFWKFVKICIDFSRQECASSNTYLKWQDWFKIQISCCCILWINRFRVG